MYGKALIKTPALFVVLAVTAATAHATSCDEVKSKIAAKIDANHVVGYTLDAVAAADVGDRKVVGSCEGGSKKIVYERGGAHAAAGKAEGAADKK